MDQLDIDELVCIKKCIAEFMKEADKHIELMNKKYKFDMCGCEKKCVMMNIMDDANLPHCILTCEKNEAPKWCKIINLDMEYNCEFKTFGSYQELLHYTYNHYNERSLEQDVNSIHLSKKMKI